MSGAFAKQTKTRKKVCDFQKIFKKIYFSKNDNFHLNIYYGSKLKLGMTFTREDQFDVPAYLDKLLKVNSKDAPLIDKLISMSAKYLRNSEQARDVVQDVMIHLLEGGINHYDPSRSFRKWITKVTKNRCVDEIRKKYSSPRMTNINDTYDVSLLSRANNRPLQVLVLKEIVDRVQEGLDSLPNKYRDPIKHRKMGLSHSEIAHILDIPVGTVKSRISAGRKILRIFYGID